MSNSSALDGINQLSPLSKGFAITIYSMLSTLGILTNSLIVLVILYFRRLRVATNILIMNLAFADLMISCFCMPFSYWHVIIFNDQRWVFGAFFCKLFAFLQATAVFLSSWTLVAISLERFTAIIFIFTPSLRLTSKRALMLLGLTWLFSIIMAAPLFYVNRVYKIDGVKICDEFGWKQLENELGLRITHTYGSLLFALQYCLPLLVIFVTYTSIGIKMWNRHVPGDIRFSKGLTKERYRPVKKLVRMVLLVSALYAFCWLPQNLLMNILLPWNSSIASHPYILYFWWIAHTIAMSHSIVNAFVYYNRNARLREGFRFFLKFLPFIKFDGFHLLLEQKCRGVGTTKSAVYKPMPSDSLSRGPRRHSMQTQPFINRPMLHLHFTNSEELNKYLLLRGAES